MSLYWSDAMAAAAAAAIDAADSAIILLHHLRPSLFSDLRLFGRYSVTRRLTGLSNLPLH